MKAVAEAPSKAIITGEHFVVHGAWALAAALPRRVRVDVTPHARFEVTSDRFGRGSPELSPVSSVIESMSREFSAKPTVSVSIRSSVPGGAGLGSSASTMVAVAAAYSRLNSLGLGASEIVRCAMVGERQIHGNPSGIDPTVCAYGGAVLFRPGSPPKRLRLVGPRSLLISYTGMDRSTRSQISRVARMQERVPSLFSMLVAGVSDLSLSASEMLLSGDMKALGGLLNLNQAVLSSVGVSSVELERVIDLAGTLGCYGAKLTGGGGGGSVVAVAPEAKEKRIVSGLSARGFETFKATTPAEGVKSWLER